MINKLENIIKNEVINQLLDYSDFVRSQIPYHSNIVKKNEYLVQLVKVQKIINSLYLLIKKLYELESDKVLKKDIFIENVLLVDQQVMKDYINYIHSVLKSWDIPESYWKPKEQELINSFYDDIKTHSKTQKINFVKIEKKLC